MLPLSMSPAVAIDLARQQTLDAMAEGRRLQQARLARFRRPPSLRSSRVSRGPRVRRLHGHTV